MNISRVTNISLALAVAVFALGYTIPSFADNPKTCGDGTGHCDHGDEGSGDGATVDLGVGMHSTGLPVTVYQDNFKKIRLNSINFMHEIKLQFGVDTKDCVQSSDDLTIVDRAALVTELNGGIIESGSFVMERDRKKSTGIIVIEYTNSELGLIQVSYSGHIVPPAPDVTEDDEMFFDFRGTIFIVWTDQLLACTNTEVTVTLNR